MKRILFVAVVVAALTSAPSLWAGAAIVLSPSLDGSSCSFQDVAGIIEVHVIVRDVEGLSAIQFAAPRPTCWSSATWLSEEYATELVIGESQDPEYGVSIAFGQCLDGPVYVGTIRFWSEGLSQPCCDYPIVKASGDGYPEVSGPIVVLCSDPTRVAGITVDVTINPDEGCPCLGSVSAAETTWGAIKALYR